MAGGLMGAESKNRGAAVPTDREPSGGEAPAVSIDPEEVRAIRKRLGLSQAEAGELLGGGPRAFTKYEAGTVKPAAAVVTLLRLLERNPALVGQLRGRKSSPMTPSRGRSPFEIGGEHVERFDQHLLPELLRRLLHAEAHAHRLPTDGIHVASNITAPDGGEDGRIEWQGGPDHTHNLPCRRNQFQLKAGPITPAQAGKDPVRGGQVKRTVRMVLDAGGHYRMLCGHPYTGKAIETRTQRLRKAVRDAGVSVEDSQISFWDADQIAAWVNQHPAVAIWVKEWTQPGAIGPFRSWTHWAGHPDHDSLPFVSDDERLPPLRDRLGELRTPRTIVRLVGLSGVGKSRLALEALSGTDNDHALSDIVMYADESQANTSDILQTVDALASSGAHAVVVVNRCSPETHRILVGSASRTASQLSLLTIDEEPATPSDTTIKIDDAPPAVVEAIIGRVAPNLPPLDHRRLVHFSEGSPRIAIDVARAWLSSRPVAHAEDDDIVNAFVLGRRPTDPDYTLKSAMLLAAFGVVDVNDHGQLSEVASFHDDLSVDGLRIGINRLLDRGVVRRRGRFGVIQPRPIAMRLAERQWRDWNPEQWERLLASDSSRQLRSLRTTAARVLARLNTTSTAQSTARHVCRRAGPRIQMDVLPALAEIAPTTVLQTLEHVLSKIDDLTELAGDARRYVVRALERIVFHAESFHQAAPLLLRLVAAETETWADNATGTFVGLFRVHLGNTAADGDARLALIQDVVDTAAVAERRIVVDALIETLTPMAWRMIGAEVQGSRPAMSSWLPQTKDAETRYVTGCLYQLASIAAEELADLAVKRARSGLGERLRSWINPDYMDAIEDVVRQVSSVVGSWPEAVESLGHALKFDAGAHRKEITRRVEVLLRTLRPANIEDRIHLLVTAMPWDYPADEDVDLDERGKRQERAVRNLALDLAQAPHILQRALPLLSRGEQRKALNFGHVLGGLPDQFKPHVWRRRITRAALDAPATERNLDLLIGYFVGIAKQHPRLAAPLKRRLARSSDLASALPSVCAGIGIRPSDIELAVYAFEKGHLPPAALGQWEFGSAFRQIQLSEAAPLFDSLLTRDEEEALAMALRLIAAYSFARMEKLDGLRRLVRVCVSRCADGGNWPAETMASCHLEQLVNWMLSNGREDADARTTALDLARVLVESLAAVRGDLPGSVVRRLLSDFPEVVWPRLGAAIVADPGLAVRLGLILGTPFSKVGERPILALPVETLFSWLRAYPNAAPAFAARVLPVLAKEDEKEGDEQTLHPTLHRLIDEFGGREDVLSGIASNIGTYSWTGSMTRYYRRFQGPLEALAGHDIAAVRHWAAHMTRELQARIKSALDHDAELDVEWDI